MIRSRGEALCIERTLVLRHSYLSETLRELRKYCFGRSRIVLNVFASLLSSSEGAYASGKTDCLMFCIKAHTNDKIMW
jgi:hypothetical protein